MSRKNALLITIVTAFLVISLYFFNSESTVSKGQTVDIDTTVENVLHEIDQTEQYLDKTYKWYDEKLKNITNLDNQMIDAPYFEADLKHENHNPKKEIIDYFVTSLIINDVDLFFSVFHPETLSKDLFKSTDTNKRNVASNFIKQITRNGEIKEIYYKLNNTFKSRNKSDVTFTFIYNDGKEAIINIDLYEFTDKHSDYEHTTYVISTSILNIISQIEKAIP